MSARMIKDLASRLADGILAKVAKEYNGREAAVPRKRQKRFILERDCYVDQKKDAVEDLFSWVPEKYGESTIARIRRMNGKIPYGASADYARSHTPLRRRCDFTANGKMHQKDKGYMKLLRMYMKAIKQYIAEGSVVAASTSAGETAVAVCSQTAVAVCSDDPNIKHIPKRPRPAQYESTKRGVIQNWKRRRVSGGGEII